MPNKRRRLTGRVIRNSMDKTVVVEVQSTTRHPLYKKVVRTTKSFKAHDESNAIPVGAMVQIVESRPISKTKRWAVETVLATPEVEEAVPADVAAEIPADLPADPEATHE